MAYNVVFITITDVDGNSYGFEMQNYSLTDPVDQTSRYGQKVQTGVGDPWNLTGEINYFTPTINFLKTLAQGGGFFTLTTEIKVTGVSTEKRTYKECLVQSDVYLASLERGAEQLITINFSLNSLQADTVK